MANARKRRSAAKKLAGKPLFWKEHGWSYGLSFQPLSPKDDTQAPLLAFVEQKTEKPAPPETLYCIFSAILWPHGRGSTVQDWGRLGSTLAALQIPVEACATPLENQDPNAVHYWLWFELGSGQVITANLDMTAPIQQMQANMASRGVA